MQYICLCLHTHICIYIYIYIYIYIQYMCAVIPHTALLSHSKLPTREHSFTATALIACTCGSFPFRCKNLWEESIYLDHSRRFTKFWQLYLLLLNGQKSMPYPICTWTINFYSSEMAGFEIVTSRVMNLPVTASCVYFRFGRNEPPLEIECFSKKSEMRMEKCHLCKYFTVFGAKTTLPMMLYKIPPIRVTVSKMHQKKANREGPMI